MLQFNCLAVGLLRVGVLIEDEMNLSRAKMGARGFAADVRVVAAFLGELLIEKQRLLQEFLSHWILVRLLGQPFLGELGVQIVSH